MYSIKDMMAAGRTTARAVRWWEDQGLLGTVERTDAGHRRYTQEQVTKAKYIGASQAVGLSLETIRQMEFDGFQINVLRGLLVDRMQDLELPQREYDL